MVCINTQKLFLFLLIFFFISLSFESRCSENMYYRKETNTCESCFTCEKCTRFDLNCKHTCDNPDNLSAICPFFVDSDICTLNEMYSVQLSDNPDVRLVYNFLKPGEAEHFINNFSDRLKVSGGVADHGQTTYGDFRTSTSSFLRRAETDIVAGIEERIAKYTNSTIYKMEPLQLLNYKNGQQFKYHYDWFTDNHVISYGGQR